MSDGVDGAPAAPDELSAKQVFWRSEAVNARLFSTFGEGDAAAAAVLLAELAPDPGCTPDADVASCRLMLAALRVSEGELTRLALWVEAGREDPRDLIAAAEYPREVASFASQADDGADAVRKADLDGYLDWLRFG